MLSLLVVLAFIATLPAILMFPQVGVLVWFWLAFMNPHRLTWGGTNDFQFAMIAGATALIGWLIADDKKRLPMNAVTWLLIALTLWVSFTTVFAVAPEAAFAKWDKTIKILLMTFLAISLMQTRERIHALVWVIVISLGIFAIRGGIGTIIGGGKYPVWGPPGSFIESNNQLALALIVALPLVRHLQLQTKDRFLRIGLMGLLVLQTFSIIGSSSRGAFLGLIAMAAFLIMKSRYKMRFGLLALCLGAGLAMFVPDTWVDRMRTIENYEEDRSAQGRFEAWEFAFRAAVDRPITGGGFLAYNNKDYFMRLVPEAMRPRSIHSVYFEVLGDHGFIGLGLFLTLMAATWQSFGRIIKENRDRPERKWAADLAAMGQVSLIGYAVTGAFLNLAFFDLYYAVIAIAVCLYGALKATDSEQAVAAQRPTFEGRRFAAHLKPQRDRG